LTSTDNWSSVSPAAFGEFHQQNPLMALFSMGAIFLVIFGLHAFSRNFWAGRISRQLPRSDMPGNLVTAFEKNTSIWRSVFHNQPTGWSRRAAKRIRTVIDSSGIFVQKLNDTFANPSGRSSGSSTAAEAQLDVNNSSDQEKIG
jgi:hypothetical protein